MLDPACGSGTFLYMTIREKRRHLGDSTTTLTHILSSVVGMDIHPLACIVAKANYVLALGDLMTRRRGRVGIPVYMVNTIRPPSEPTFTTLHRVKCSTTQIDSHQVFIPESLIADPEKYDRAVEAARDFASHAKGQKVDSEAFANFLKTHYPALVEDDEVRVLFTVAETLKEMIESGRDTIWAFVLKNIFKPLLLKNAFDIVVGNPPWLSYRDMERSDYQAFLKEQIVRRYGLVVRRAELIANLELGSLFLVRCADLYLRDGGKIGFVLPKSVFSAEQHDAFRKGKMKSVELLPVSLWDLEGVKPLFRTSAAVYIGEKSHRELKGPIPGQVLQGGLPTRNADLKAAEAGLTCHEVAFSLSTMGKGSCWTSGQTVDRAESVYRSSFRKGASLFPRCFWCVDVRKSDLGFDHSLPPLVSSQRAQGEAKPAFKTCVLDGNVENRFLFTTLLPVDMVPFGFLRLRLMVLPVLEKAGRFQLLQTEAATSGGFVRLAAWLRNVEREWQTRRGSKADKMTIYERLDYAKGITQQSPIGVST